MSKLKSFILEIDAILIEIKRVSSKTLKDDSLKERLCQLLETWCAIRSYVASFYTNSHSLKKIDTYLEYLARDANKRVLKSKFNVNLRTVKTEIVSKIQIEEIKAGTPKESFIEQGIGGQVKFLEEVPDVLIQLMPKSLIGWKTNIKKFLQQYPFDHNVFIMTRYAKSSNNIIKNVMNEIKNFESNDKRFNPIIANENKITDDLYNPIACLLCCQYGVAIFDSPTEGLSTHNPNVAYELGFMHLLQRECLILKSDKLKSMPTDILQKLYNEYSSSNSATAIIKDWLKNQVQES